MSGSSGPGTQHVLRNRKIYADYAILIKADFVQPKHSGYDQTQDREQKRSRSLRELSGLLLAFVHDDGDVKEIICARSR